jgi:CBS domain containing-hemolysin-like protein
VFEEMLDNRAHILLVVDHYGGAQGIVTLEDVVETLIGIEIVDEADKIDDMRRLARQKWEERMERLGIDVREPEGEPPGEERDE